MCAELLAEANGHVALTGGTTPARAYELAAELRPDWSATEVWWGDDRCVPPEHEWSNYGLAKRTLLDRLAVQPAAVHRIQGELGAERAADEYDRELEGVTLDLVLLGMGPDGHIASLYPHAPGLAERERRAIPAEAKLEPLVDRVTMTIPVFESAPLVLFFVAGAERADAVRRAFAEPPSEATPASLVRSKNGQTVVILDPAAAQELRDLDSRCRFLYVLPMADADPGGEPLGILTIDKPEQLKALGHPLRLRVLELLGENDELLTNRELAQRLEVDPGHLHFHVRTLLKAELIQRVEGGHGREKPYRAVANTIRVAPELLTSPGATSDVHAAILDEVNAGWAKFGPLGKFRSAQVTVRIAPERVREIWELLSERVDELEDPEQDPIVITLVFHPHTAS